MLCPFHKIWMCILSIPPQLKRRDFRNASSEPFFYSYSKAPTNPISTGYPRCFTGSLGAVHSTNLKRRGFSQLFQTIRSLNSTLTSSLYYALYHPNRHKRPIRYNIRLLHFSLPRENFVEKCTKAFYNRRKNNYLRLFRQCFEHCCFLCVQYSSPDLP